MMHWFWWLKNKLKFKQVYLKASQFCKALNYYQAVIYFIPLSSFKYFILQDQANEFYSSELEGYVFYSVSWKDTLWEMLQ